MTQLMQLNVGKRNYGFIEGPLGYIVMDNDFCHQARPLNEPTDLRDTWTFNGEHTYQRTSLAEMRASAAPVKSYQQWAHYWGIKPRIASNYAELLRSMREIGADTSGMPKFGEEPTAPQEEGSNQ